MLALRELLQVEALEGVERAPCKRSVARDSLLAGLRRQWGREEVKQRDEGAGAE